MTQEQILKKAIEKAIKNGLEQEPTEHVYLISRVFGVKTINKEWLRGFIFSHQFAKAFFGIGERVTDQDTREELYQFEDGKFRGMQNYTTSNLPAWQYHLQQMVLCENPISYLKKFL